MLNFIVGKQPPICYGISGSGKWVTTVTLNIAYTQDCHRFCSAQRPAAGLQPQHNLPVLFNGPGYVMLFSLLYMDSTANGGAHSKNSLSVNHPVISTSSCKLYQHFYVAEEVMEAPAWPYCDQSALLPFHQGGPGLVSLI